MNRKVQYRQPLTVSEFRELPRKWQFYYLDFLFGIFIGIGKVQEFMGLEYGVFQKMMMDAGYKIIDKGRSSKEVDELLTRRIQIENDLVGESQKILIVSVRALINIVKEKDYSKPLIELVDALIPKMVEKQQNSTMKEVIEKTVDFEKRLKPDERPEVFKKEILDGNPLKKKRVMSEEQKQKISEGRKRALDAKKAEKNLEPEIIEEPVLPVKTGDGPGPLRVNSLTSARTYSMKIEITGSDAIELYKMYTEILERFMDDPRGEVSLNPQLDYFASFQ